MEKIVCVKCKQSYLPKEIHKMDWGSFQECKKCYNKRKREYCQKKNETIIKCPVCNCNLKFMYLRHHKNTKKHQNNLTVENCKDLNEEDKDVLLKYFNVRVEN